MILKKLLSTICVILGVLSISNAFNDLPRSHWAYNDVQKMVDNGVVSGYADGSFKPEKQITKEEFATILTKVLNLSDERHLIINYEDVEASRWSKPYIEAVTKYYSYTTKDGKYYFNPFAATTREEVAAAVIKAMGLDNETPNYSVLDKFSDKDLINQNYKDCVAIAVEKGIMNGNANGTFRPNGNLTRAQIASLMNNVIEEITINIDSNSEEEKPIEIPNEN